MVIVFRRNPIHIWAILICMCYWMNVCWSILIFFAVWCVVVSRCLDARHKWIHLWAMYTARKKNNYALHSKESPATEKNEVSNYFILIKIRFLQRSLIFSFDSNSHSVCATMEPRKRKAGDAIYYHEIFIIDLEFFLAYSLLRYT